MKKRLCILLAVITLSACANAGIIDYFRDRGADLLDIFLLRISVAHKARAFGALRSGGSISKVNTSAWTAAALASGGNAVRKAE